MKKLLKTGIVFCLFFQTTLIEAQQQIFNHKQLITDGRVWDNAFEDLNKEGYLDLFYSSSMVENNLVLIKNSTKRL